MPKIMADGLPHLQRADRSLQMLDARTWIDHWKARGLDFSRLFAKPDMPASVALFHCDVQDHKTTTLSIAS